METLTCPKCNFLREPQAAACPACGIVYGKYQAPAPDGGLNPQAPSRSPPASAWREGELLVMCRKGAQLPDRCVCCNQPTTYHWVTHIFWNPGASRLMQFIWPIVLMLTRSIELAIPLCEAHQRKRQQGLLIAAFLTLVGGALLAADWFRNSGAPLFVPFLVLGLALAGGGLIYLLAGANPLNVVEISDDYVWLERADIAFLRALEAGMQAPAAAAGPKPKLHPLLDRYAAPLSGTAAPSLPGPAAPREGVWSREGLLIVRIGASLPGRCVVCNRSAGNRWSKTFSWTPPSLFAGREKADLTIPLCEEHDGERKVKTRNSWLLAVGGIALIAVSVFAMFNGAAGAGQLLMGVGFLTLVIAAAVSSSASPLKPKRITSQYAFLKKAGDTYLRSLPPAPPSIGWPSG